MDSFSAQAAYPSPQITPTISRFQINEVVQTQQPRNLLHFLQNQSQNQRITKRHRRILRDNIPAALNKPTIRRLARRGGVKRIRLEIYQTMQQVVKNKLKEILEPAIALVEHKKQKTLTALDVVYALRLVGNPIYGCGTIYRGNNVSSNAAYMRKRRAGYAQNVREVQARLDREEQNRRIDEHVRRLGGSANLRYR